MKQHDRNKWFQAPGLVDVAQVISDTAKNEPLRWLEHGIDCKYLTVQVDMRSGDFIIKNAFGDRLSNEDILKMFPALAPIEVTC